MAVGIRTDIPSDVTRTTICVDRLENGEIYGRCYNPYYRVNPRFTGLAALIGRMELIFDSLSYPQRTLEPRKFRVRAIRRRIRTPDTKEGGRPMEEMKLSEARRGEKATFVVSVQFRQNATWQGTVSWSEQKATRRFRSMLELISLMNDALIEDDSMASWEIDNETSGEETER